MMDAWGSREVVARQFELVWMYATDVVIREITLDEALWQPFGNVVTVHKSDLGWFADWPDESLRPLPAPTIGWLLWHIEWWWSSTLRCVDGRNPVQPDSFEWSGGTERIVELYQQWKRVLNDRDLGETMQWLMPEPQKLSFIASWVNFELTKNLSEIGLLKSLRENEDGLVTS